MSSENYESRIEGTNRRIGKIIENIKEISRDGDGIGHRRFYELTILMEIAKSLAVIADRSDGKDTVESARWIPCDERLPEKSDLYCVSGKGKVWICEFHIIPNFIGGWHNDVSNPVVQAWMPLPEPYKEEQE